MITDWEELAALTAANSSETLIMTRDVLLAKLVAGASPARPDCHSRAASKYSRDNPVVAEFDTTAVQRSPPVELGARKAVPHLRTRAPNGAAPRRASG
jgi:hypothetical protein